MVLLAVAAVAAAAAAAVAAAVVQLAAVETAHLIPCVTGPGRMQLSWQVSTTDGELLRGGRAYMQAAVSALVYAA